MNIIAATRAALGLSQAEFGEWLGEQLGRSPVPQPRVAEWESGMRSPRRNVRLVCAPVVSRALAEHAVCAITKATGAGNRLSADLASIRDDIAEAIGALIA